MTTQITPVLHVVKPPPYVEQELLEKVLHALIDEMYGHIEALGKRLDAQLLAVQRSAEAVLSDCQRRVAAAETAIERQAAESAQAIADMQRQIADLEREVAEVRQALAAESALREQLDPSVWVAHLVDAVRAMPRPEVNVDVENTLPTTDEDKTITYNDAGDPVGIKVTRKPK